MDVHVHTDRRACITAPILKSFAELAGRDELPKHVFVTRVPEGIELRWHQTNGAKSYDLSIRDRVLVGGFIPGETLTVKSLDGVVLALATAKGLAAANAVQSPKPTPAASPHVAKPKKATPKVSAPKPKKAAPKVSAPKPKKTTPKVSTPKTPNPPKDQVMSLSITDLVLPGICLDVRQNHSSLSLLEVARQLDKVSPGITVGQFVAEEGTIIIDYDAVTGRPATPSAPRPRATTPAKSAPKATSKGPSSSSKPASSSNAALEKECMSRLQQAKRDGKTELSIHDFGKNRDEQIRARGVLHNLVEQGKVIRTGNTRGTRYHLA